MMWQPIETAPKDKAIDVWCVVPEDCDFDPECGGIRLTGVWWHIADDGFPYTGWTRIVDDGHYDPVESNAACRYGLPAWKVTHWMAIPGEPS